MPDEPETKGMTMRGSTVAHPLLFLLPAALIWAFVFFIGRSHGYDSPGLLNTMSWLMPAVFALWFLVMVGLAVADWLHRRKVADLGTPIRSHLVWLILLIAVSRVILVPATSRLYYDEHAYRQLARGIADEGRLELTQSGEIQGGTYHCHVGEYPHWSAGWPTLLGMTGKLFGHTEYTGFVLNLLFSLLTALLVARIAERLFPGRGVGVPAAAIYALLPANQLWSLTNASETSATLVSSWAIYVTLASQQKPDRPEVGFFALALAGLAAQIRNELLLILPVILVLNPALIRRRPACLAVVLILLAPQALHLGIVSSSYAPGEVEGAGFHLQHLLPNLASVVGYLTNAPLVLVALLLAACCCVFGASHRHAQRMLGCWMGAVFLPPMCYFAASLAYPGGERFLLAALPPIAILAGERVATFHAQFSQERRQLMRLTWATCLITAMALTHSHALLQDEATTGPRTDSQFLQQALNLVPPDAVVFTSFPPAVIAENRSARRYEPVEKLQLIATEYSKDAHRDIYLLDLPTRPLTEDRDPQAISGTRVVLRQGPRLLLRVEPPKSSATPTR